MEGLLVEGRETECLEVLGLLITDFREGGPILCLGSLDIDIQSCSLVISLGKG